MTLGPVEWAPRPDTLAIMTSAIVDEESTRPVAPPTPRPTATIDANQAVASVAYRATDVIAIYPITPSSPMGEHADEWASAGRPNLWGTIPDVVEMQSEGGAAGAVHGALQAGSSSTTFTASQGLLLMLPNMFKIAGELTPFCMHVAARSLATHALSIFGDHADVMAARSTGFAMLASGSPQEAQDLAAIAHAATLECRIPFMHFFDGFRTSHEIQKIDLVTDEVLRGLIDRDALAAHRDRALSPERPVIRGTSQNPDTFFQAREAANPFYDACPDVVEQVMARFERLTGRHYAPFEYVGHPEADRVIVLMGSGAECVHETVDHLLANDERVGVVKVRLYRPFSMERLIDVLPATTRSIAVLDRVKEPGATGEPLLLDVMAALVDAVDRRAIATLPRLIGGRYGLSSKEFTPAMAMAVFAELDAIEPRRRFTIGINDDVTHLSLPYDDDLDIEAADVTRAVFHGLGADGTVSSNKATIKIIGDHTDLFAQGHFVYDSKKSGATTVSHLRFGPRPIRSTYLIRRAGFVGVHDPGALDRLDVLDSADRGAVVLINTATPPDEVWDRLPVEVQRTLVERECRLHVIDASSIAESNGLGRRINTIMQTCFFALSGVLPLDEAIDLVKQSVASTWGRRGSEVVRRNTAAIDAALEHLHRVPLGEVTSTRSRRPGVPADAPEFVQRVTRMILEGKGDLLPVSVFPPDGTWPTGTSRYEKRGIAHEIPIWEPDLCVQCNKCSTICPHAAIRTHVFDPAAAADAPPEFRSIPESGTPEFEGLSFVVATAPDDCTGCGLCVEVCPAKDRSRPKRKAINMEPIAEHLDRERIAWDVAVNLPEVDRRIVPREPKRIALLPALFEFSGACSGCGETPYVKTLTQLFGDRLMIANATGCSSIYGGNLPTTPYTTDQDGRGPAWANSLFEDNAEFGFGMRLGVDALERRARELLTSLATRLPERLVDQLSAPGSAEVGAVAERRDQIVELRRLLAEIADPDATELDQLADHLVPRSMWIVGGDGWAYDIGYGGLDHILSSNRKVNVLVLDTEVYSNTGGQQSKSTPLGAIAKFAAAGKETSKKDLGLLAMTYGHVYVASIAIQSRGHRAITAMMEADAHPGPSLVIAHSPCIAHGYDLIDSPAQQQRAIKSGAWPLYRFDPARIDKGEPPLQIDADPMSIPIREYMDHEPRFRMVELRDPERYRRLVDAAQRAVRQRHDHYEQLSHIHLDIRERTS